MMRWVLALILALVPLAASAQPGPQQPIVQRIQIVGGTNSFQDVQSDLAWGGIMGHSGAYVGAVMGNFAPSLSTLTGGQNGPNAFGVLGKWSDGRTGYTCQTGSVCYPRAGVIGENSGVADAAILAIASDTTNSVVVAQRAMYGVDQQFYVPTSTVTYGLDLKGKGAHDGYVALAYAGCDINTSQGTCIKFGSGAPTNGLTGTCAVAAVCPKGSLYIDVAVTAGKLAWYNAGTAANPTWTNPLP